jgi:uncharacterized protein involved in outer membrane biogenesis
MKAIKILLVLVAVVVAILVAGLLYVNHYIQRPEFKQKMLSVARKALRTDIQVKELKVSIFTGAELEGVAIANPTGFAGNLLTAKSFRLHYKLLPLLRKRVQIATISLQEPTIVLARNAKNEWNYERFTGEKATTAPAVPAEPKSVGGMEVAIDRVLLGNSTVTMRDEAGKEMLKITGADFSTTVNLTGSRMDGQGELKIAAVNIANSLTLRSLAAPVALQGETIKLAPLTGKLAGGDITGDATLRLDKGDLYAANLQVKDADVKRLLQEAGVSRLVMASGKLHLNASVTGKGGMETIVGTGSADVANGVLLEMPLQDIVAALLQVPELREIKFDECRMEFSISNNVMQTPVIKLSSPRVRVTGSGSVSLADYTLNHRLTLLLSKETLARAPKEIVEVFEEQPDGFYAIHFKVTCPYDSPKTDLGQRLLKGGVRQLLKKLL